MAFLEMTLPPLLDYKAQEQKYLKYFVLDIFM